MNPNVPSPTLIFDFVDDINTAQRVIFSDPIRVISVNQVAHIEAALREVEQFVNQGYYAAGYVSYEAAPAFDSAFSVSSKSALPLLWFGIFDQPSSAVNNCPWEEKFRFTPWESTVTQEQYRQHVKKIKQAISQGETYQVNYTMRLRSYFEGDDLGLYHRLIKAQQAGYAAYLNLGRMRILSISPELFFNLDGQNIVTRPMKGTAKRGRWQEEDEVNASWLRSSEKNRAENVMIVDLLRNDLGRIAQVGSVRVPQLFEIEKYPTLFQMTSTVSAKLLPNLSVAEIFQSLFPCGSITGAPKISTMRLIAELENEPREIYCGSIGFMNPNGTATFNVAIRTLLMDSETGMAEYGVGGGITWDSVDDDEYHEALTKADVLGLECPPFELLETLKLDNGEYALRDRHVERLVKSAQYFGLPIEAPRVMQSLQEHAKHHGGASRRVRLLASQNGAIRVESVPLTDLAGVSGAAMPVALARTPVSKHNRFLYHKTTNRSLYEAHRAQSAQTFDVLLWNDNGEITEFTNGSIVVEMDGVKLTPALESGLLPGTFRAQLLADGVVEEKVLSLDDLQHATQIWFINSVRGWVRVYLVE